MSLCCPVQNEQARGIEGVAGRPGSRLEAGLRDETLEGQTGTERVEQAGLIKVILCLAAGRQLQMCLRTKEIPYAKYACLKNFNYFP